MSETGEGPLHLDPTAFTAEIVTRGTEIDTTATVPMNAYVRYFEHLRWLVMQEPELGLVDLIHEGHFFVVRSQTLALRRRIGQGVGLHLETRFSEVGRSTARVHHTARQISDGAVVAEAQVIGVWLGPHRRMARLPDTFRAAAQARRSDARPATDPAAVARVLGTSGGRPMSFTAPPVVELAPLGVEVEAPPVAAFFDFEHAIVVPPRDLDVFSHVNAATFLAYADDARWFAARAGVLPPDLALGHVARVALFYAREACVGDALRVALSPLSGELGASGTEGAWRAVLETTHALGAWVFRDPEPTPLCSMRIDLAPGARAVTRPGDSPHEGGA